jgi:DNA-binding MarR family transcriptional regulator
MKSMSLTSGLSEGGEAVLLAIWKLKGIGTNTVDERQLKAEMAKEPSEDLSSTLQLLETQGFIEIKDEADRKGVSITPLGVAILRKIEEDKLQELK